MNKLINNERILTGVKNLDVLLTGGLPRGSITVIAGVPGGGKTTLATQICFNNATETNKALIFQTLSEPAAKTLKYMSSYSFFDEKKFNKTVEFVDLGAILRAKGLEKAIETMIAHIKRVKPAIVVIDSFKVFDDLARSKEELRKFTYEVAVQLTAWEITGFLVGEYSLSNLETCPLFSVVDGIITMHSVDEAGEAKRFFRIVKMRGTDHVRSQCPYVINPKGIEIYINRPAATDGRTRLSLAKRVPSGIKGLDGLLCGGLLAPSVVLVGGKAGSGKTLFMLQSIYQAAKRGEKGLIFTFELDAEELCVCAEAIGMNIRSMVKKRLIELVFVPQSQILIEKHVQLIAEKIESFKPARVGFDSSNAFLEKVEKPYVVRDKMLQICSLIKNAGAVGILTTGVAYGQNRLTKDGVIESIPDMLILLSQSPEQDRERHLEIVKMRNTDHARDPRLLEITSKGMIVK